MTRPTPEQIIRSQVWENKTRNEIADDAVMALRAHGYVIAHPGDFPYLPTWRDRSSWNKGYNEAIENVFIHGKQTES